MAVGAEGGAQRRARRAHRPAEVTVCSWSISREMACRERGGRPLRGRDGLTVAAPRSPPPASEPPAGPASWMVKRRTTQRMIAAAARAAACSAAGGQPRPPRKARIPLTPWLGNASSSVLSWSEQQPGDSSRHDMALRPDPPSLTKVGSRPPSAGRNLLPPKDGQSPMVAPWILVASSLGARPPRVPLQLCNPCPNACARLQPLRALPPAATSP